MKKTILLLFLFSCLYAHASDVDSIAKRTIRLTWAQVTQSSFITSVQNYMDNMQSDGSWPDITYTSSTTSGGSEWIPARHPDRLKQMTIAYTASWSTLKADTGLYNKIINGLNYWEAKDLSGTSWWFNEIAVPKSLGLIMLMMKYEGAQKIDSSLEASLISMMTKGNSSAQSGANRIDIATHFIYRGCLTNDSSLIRKNADLIYGENDLRTGEGLQHDYSYAQHSNQLHIFGYGDVYAYGQVITAYTTAGTAFAIPAAKMSNLSIFFRETILNEIRGTTHTYHSFGRQISRPGATGVKNWIDLFNKMAVLDAAYATTYNNAVARMQGLQAPGAAVPAVHKHYWRTDYTSMQNPAFSFSTRFSSTKTVQAESGNGENPKGGYLSIGSTSVMVNGNEYFDIFPIWDWNKIPGTTAPEKTTVPQNPYITKGTSTFAGGASTGKVGVSVFSMNRQWNISAQKSWFMFENEIVCLGNGINTNAASPVEVINTTVNQSFLDGNVTVLENGNITTVNANTQTVLINPKWILHDSIAYIFPGTAANLNISTTTQNGAWSDINERYSTTTMSNNVFKLWFNHGAAPSGSASSYAYIIAPGKKTTAEVQAYNAADLVIIANDTIVQAVKKISTNTIQAIFYAAASLTSGAFTVKADQPCALILENINTDNIVLTISDPSKTSGRTINVTITAPGKLPQTVSLQMPSGTSLLGSSLTKRIDMTGTVFNADSTSLSLTPIADSYVRAGSYAGNNYGSDNTLVVKNDIPSYTRETYLKFDLSEVPNHQIASAILKLALSGGNTNAPNTTVAVYKSINDGWTEAGITWNNKPGSTNNIVASAGGKTSGMFEFNITNAVLEEMATDKMLTLRISSETLHARGDITLFSKEASVLENRPVLLLQLATATVTPVADSYVRDGSYANNNYGNDNTLVIKNDNSSYKRETYLKFDLSDVKSHQIASAKLKLALSGGNSNAPNTTIAIRKGSDDAWSEMDITWNNKPASLDNIVASAAGKTSGTFEFNISSAVQEAMATDKVLTLRISSETKNATGDLTLFSKETSTPEKRPVLLLLFAGKTTASTTITPVKDSYVRAGGYANNNYGQETTLSVKNDQVSSYARQSFLQFHLGELKSSSIAKARLRIYIDSAGAGITSTKITANAVANDNWTETGITWNNKPATGAVLDSVNGTNNGYMEFDITEQAKLDADVDQVLSLNIGSTVAHPQGNIAFYSKENSLENRRPQLIIELSGDSARPSSRKAPVPLLTAVATAAKGVAVYPNPVSATLQVSASSSIISLRIIDANGIVKKQIAFDAKANIQKVQIDVSMLRAGIYILAADLKDGKTAHKFTKH